MLHCITQSSIGGQSFFVDAFKCAQVLKESFPDDFEVLTNTKVLFSFCDSERSTWFRENWPVIKHENGVIKEIHYSDFSMRAPILPLEELNNFYRAYR